MKKIILIFITILIIFFMLYCDENNIEIELPTPTPSENEFTYPELTGDNLFGTVFQVKFNFESVWYDHDCQSAIGFVYNSEFGYNASCEDDIVSIYVALDYMTVKVFDCNEDGNCCVKYSGADSTDYWSCKYNGNATMYIDHVEAGYINGQFFGKLYSVFDDYYDIQNGYFSGYLVH